MVTNLKILYYASFASVIAILAWNYYGEEGGSREAYLPLAAVLLGVTIGAKGADGWQEGSIRGANRRVYREKTPRTFRAIVGVHYLLAIVSAASVIWLMLA